MTWLAVHAAGLAFIGCAWLFITWVVAAHQPEKDAS